MSAVSGALVMLFFMGAAVAASGLWPWVYGKGRTVHARFKSCPPKGVWEKLFENLKDASDHEALMVDATIVRAHACASGDRNQENEGLGRSKGGLEGARSSSRDLPSKTEIAESH
jgi:transposase